ncbi:MAG TPA: hypothetical protein PKC96_02365 [Bacilli bacterium]|nr:hypothetical protein [Bacilli bacterium]
MARLLFLSLSSTITFIALGVLILVYLVYYFIFKKYQIMIHTDSENYLILWLRHGQPIDVTKAIGFPQDKKVAGLYENRIFSLPFSLVKMPRHHLHIFIKWAE